MFRKNRLCQGNAVHFLAKVTGFPDKENELAKIYLDIRFITK